MSALTTGDLVIPTEIIDPWLAKIANGSTVAQLSAQAPMKFGTETAMIFDIGEAEYVGEGQNKSGSTITKKTKTTKPYKFQKTVRWTDEVKYADEDHQLGVIEQILNEVTPALARALDYGVFHGINPSTGTSVVAMTEHLSDSALTTAATSTAYDALDAADALVLAKGYVPSDVALDPLWAADFSTLRGQNSEQKLYPNFRLGTAVSELDGHRASVSNTVSAARVVPGGLDIVGFVGDFSTIRWGVQRRVGIEMIEYGDPDDNGDLKRNNQVAFRLEIVYGWGIADLDAICVVTADTGDES